MRKALKLLSILFISIFAVLSLYSSPVFALTEAEQACVDEKNETLLGLPKWYKYLEVIPDDSGRCSPQIEDVEDALPIGIAVLEALIRLGGLVAVVMIIIGSFKFITSQGNPDNAAAARKTIVNSLIGLAIVILSTTIVTLVGRSLGA